MIARRARGLLPTVGRTARLVVPLLVVVAAAAHLPPATAQEATPAAGTAVLPYVPPADLATVGGTVEIDGSSTVFPITDEVRLRFADLAGDVEVRHEFSGTGGGFRRLCAAEIDLANASRPIGPEEEAACAAAGVRYYRLDVASDGVTVAVHPANAFAACLTLDQLRLLWRPDDPADRWADLDPAWPDREIALFGPGEDSGTYDFFTQAVLGEAGRSRGDYFASEDDNVLVTGVADDEDALGYFGYAYYAGNPDRLRAVAIDAGSGCVAPAPETIASGTYAPLARPLHLYVRAESLGRSTVREFLRFYLAEARTVVPEVDYVPLADAAYAAQQARLEAALVGNLAPDGPAIPPA